jgi:hypothetical protein
MVSSFTQVNGATVDADNIMLQITFATSVWSKAGNSNVVGETKHTKWAGANAAAATTVYTLNGVLTADSGKVGYVSSCTTVNLSTTVTTTTCSDASSSWIVLGAISLLGAASFF